jgi:hypothetical protein
VALLSDRMLPLHEEQTVTAQAEITIPDAAFRCPLMFVKRSLSGAHVMKHGLEVRVYQAIPPGCQT